jgi:hypothetical protein
MGMLMRRHANYLAAEKKQIAAPAEPEVAAAPAEVATVVEATVEVAPVTEKPSAPRNRK